MQMNIFSDSDGYLYYNELLFYLYKYKQLEFVNKNLSNEGLLIIQREESKNLNYITERRKRETK